MVTDPTRSLIASSSDLRRDYAALLAACQTLPIARIEECTKNTFLILPEQHYGVPGDILTDLINACTRIKEAMPNAKGPAR